MAAFDPAAWVEEWEAIGGRIAAYHWAPKGGTPDLCLALTYPRDEAGRGSQMLREINTPAGDDFRSFAVVNHLACKRNINQLVAFDVNPGG